jgi:hypothetical protein
MVRITLVMLLGAVAAASLSTAPGQNAQLASCLHGPGEKPDQLRRRQDALRIAEQINSAEHGRTLRGLANYRSFDRLGVPAPPDGFRIQVDVDTATYMFSLKDTTDPCQYAIFSDQDEWIYATTPQPHMQVLRARSSEF